jgi:hypothetical protein
MSAREGRKRREGERERVGREKMEKGRWEGRRKV